MSDERVMVFIDGNNLYHEFSDGQSSLHLREISDRTIEISKKLLRDCWS